MKIHGTITGGMFSNMRELYRQFKKLEDKTVTVSITVRKPPRTNQQNAYLWAVVYKEIGDYIGDLPEAIHDEYDEILDLRKYVDENGNRRVKSTTQMSVEEMGQYIEKLKLWSWHRHNLYIPDPS